MDIKQLRQFVMLASTLNFRRAADRLHMAQPALSVSLRRLEEELGVSLFDRGRHGVALTSAGVAALDEARQVVERSQRLRDLARAGSAGEIGIVRLGFVGTAAYDLLPRLLIALRSKFPGLKVDLHEGTTSSLQSELIDGAVDLAIVRFPAAFHDAFSLEKIEVERIGVALPLAHPLTRFAEVELSQLADEPFVFPSSLQSPSLFHSTMARCLSAGFTPKIAQEISQIQTIVGLVRGGVGVALIPELVAKIFWKQIAFRPLSDHNNIPATGLGVLTRRGAKIPAALQVQDVLKDLM